MPEITSQLIYRHVEFFSYSEISTAVQMHFQLRKPATPDSTPEIRLVLHGGNKPMVSDVGREASHITNHRQT